MSSAVKDCLFHNFLTCSQAPQIKVSYLRKEWFLSYSTIKTSKLIEQFSYFYQKLLHVSLFLYSYIEDVCSSPKRYRMRKRH